MFIYSKLIKNCKFLIVNNFLVRSNVARQELTYNIKFHNKLDDISNYH